MAEALTAQQVAQIAYNAGFRGQALIDMVAIAKRESGYKPSSYNGNSDTGDQSYGLWQINMIGNLGPTRRRLFGITNNEQLLDPQTAANAAFKLSSQGTNLNAWGGYKGQSNTYSTNVPEARAAVQSAGLPAGWDTDTQGQPVAGAMASVGSGSTYTAPPQDPAGAARTAAEQYGYLAAFLQHPEIGPKLIQGAMEGWSKEVLAGELQKTDWWKSTNQAARQWAALEASDPVEAQSRVNAQAQAIMGRANQLGYPISQDRAVVIARDAQKFGWQGSELDRAIGMDASQDQLLQSNFGARLKATASSMAIPISPQTIGSWATRIARGEDTEANFQTWARSMAANLYPTATAHLNAGGTIEEFYDPYREIAAKTLQISPSQIDLSDPKWSAALSVTDPTGQRRAMRTDEWQKMLMSDDKYGFRYTKNAKDMAEEAVGNLKRMFGEVA